MLGRNEGWMQRVMIAMYDGKGMVCRTGTLFSNLQRKRRGRMKDERPPPPPFPGETELRAAHRALTSIKESRYAFQEAQQIPQNKVKQLF